MHKLNNLLVYYLFYFIWILEFEIFSITLNYNLTFLWIKLPHSTTFKLGEGSFSSVYRVRRNDDKTLYALKKVKSFIIKGQNWTNELKIKRKFFKLGSYSCFNFSS
jgi:hypothetical protein